MEAEMVDGRTLKRLRLGALMTQSELASSAGVRPETVSRIESADGPRNTATITVHKLARALEVPPDQLTGFED